MSLIVERRHSWLDLRSVIIAVVVLLVGAGIGFGVGYEVKAHRTSSTAKTVAAAKKAPAQGGQAATAGIASFRSCLTSHGVTYPAIAGGEQAFSSQISKPPAGVSKSTYDSAMRACYAAANSRARP